MSCLCHKLINKLYDNISPAESSILQQAWLEAPRLFRGVVIEPEAPTRKRRRRSQPRLDWSERHALHTDTLLASASTSSTSPTAQAIDASHITSVNNLVRTYRIYDTAITSPSSLQRHHEHGISARIFSAAEQTTRSISRETAFGRIYCVAFAEQHQSHTSVQRIVTEIQNELPSAQNIYRKVTRMLYIGKKWLDIIRTFADVVGTTPNEVNGLLGLLSSASVWEKAESAVYKFALVRLHNTTQISQRTKTLTLDINKVLVGIQSKRPFIDETDNFTPRSMVLARRSVSNSGTPRRPLHMLQATPTDWHAQAVAATSLAIRGLSNVGHQDAHILLTLLSHLSMSEKVPLDLVFRGATPRKRWTAQGETEELEAIESGLCPDLQNLLSDVSRVRNALRALESLSIISLFDQALLLNEQAARLVRETLPTEHAIFWRCQSLIVTYRAIPWKYIEPLVPNTTSFLPHLKHCVGALESNFDCLSADTKADLALTLIEASRLPTMAWKRFAVSRSKLVARDLDHPYLESCVARSRCLLARLDGETKQAVSILQNLDYNRPSCVADKRLRSAIGQEIIQESLNHIQSEAMSAAKATLERWTPVGQPSPMEEVVLVRIHILLGRISRYMGNFDESLAYLESALKITGRYGAAFFDEDLHDLICELSDTLRELDNPISAERHVRIELARRQQSCSAATGYSSLQLSLAEALFAQNRLDEASAVCAEVQSRVKLLKFEKLRLQIILAKISHIGSDFEKAFSYWEGALKTVQQYELVSGRLTRVIVLSARDASNQLGQRGLVQESTKAAENLDQLEGLGSVQHWIAGTRQWLEFVSVRRSHL